MNAVDCSSAVCELVSVLTQQDFCVKGSGFKNGDGVCHISITLDYKDRAREQLLPKNFNGLEVVYEYGGEIRFINK